MGNINVLDISVANLIAAGEVVERPASVVKELIENSIDAGAKNITVEIKNGGVSLIRVTDDGCGMSKDDLPVCILRHATSKIKTKHDLNMIKTLGFRGEALAAIASVSRLRIITKQKDGSGYVLESHGGTVSRVEETGCADGTSVIVEELFGNVPARRKFLKKDTTEASAVMSVCEKTALSHPEISVTFISDNTLRFRTAADGKLKNTIYSVFGREFANNLLEIDGQADGIEVQGYIGTPSNSRPNRNMQIFFVNGRYVKNRSIQAALEAAVQSYVPTEKFPTAVLNVTIHPGFVDVNVHPAKTEIKFSSEKTVFDAVYLIIKDAVDKSTQRPTLKIEDISKPQVRFTPIEDGRTESLQKRQIAQEGIFEATTKPAMKIAEEPQRVTVESPKTVTEIFKTVTEPPKAEQAVFEKYTPDSFKTAANDEYIPNDLDVPVFPSVLRSPEVTLTEKSEAEKPVFTAKAEEVKSQEPVKVDEKEEYKPTKLKGEYKLKGEIFNTYLIVESGDEAYIIDKHAAHERIIFEELKLGVKIKAGYSQMLMIPLEIPLSDEEASAGEEYREEITKTGFSYEITSGMATVNEIPSNLTEGAAVDLFITILGELSSGTGNAVISRDLLYEKALYQSACKAAIKAGDLNTHEELEALVDRLMACPEITHCPHGRPVAFIMTRSSVERRFGRT